MPTSPFIVLLGELSRLVGARRAERRQGPIAGLRVSGSAVPEGADVTVDVVLESVPKAVIARGSVSAPWSGECRRCLREASGALQAEVVEVFEEDPDPEETYPLEPDRLDLEPLARDAVLLELPLAPLCRADCRGLCPMCGADLNQAGCQCQVAGTDPRWAALNALRDS
ncbi:MAG TPA: DUF177 domain-containing protein [Acidimicrobiales bacterium]|nr:DUF177 domain-containing protein [Acidimicrobiales bacterium]